jgi:hypothetical protein
VAAVISTLSLTLRPNEKRLFVRPLVFRSQKQTPLTCKNYFVKQQQQQQQRTSPLLVFITIINWVRAFANSIILPLPPLA